MEIVKYHVNGVAAWKIFHNHVCLFAVNEAHHAMVTFIFNANYGGGAGAPVKCFV